MDAASGESSEAATYDAELNEAAPIEVATYEAAPDEAALAEAGQSEAGQTEAGEAEAETAEARMEAANSEPAAPSRFLWEQGSEDAEFADEESAEAWPSSNSLEAVARRDEPDRLRPRHPMASALPFSSRFP